MFRIAKHFINIQILTQGWDMWKSILESVAVDYIKERASKLILLIPPSITAYFYENAYLIIACVLLASLSVFLGWEYHKCKKLLTFSSSKVQKFENAGLVDILESTPNTTMNALEKAQSRFYFLGVSAKSTAYNNDLPIQLTRLRNNNYGYEVKFLIMDPSDIQSITARASDENDSPNSWTHDMKSSISRLQAIAAQTNVNIQIRLFKNEYPLWRMVIIDNHSIYLNYALQTKRINQSHLIHLKQNPASLANTHMKYFDQLWNRATPLDTWLQSNTL